MGAGRNRRVGIILIVLILVVVILGVVAFVVLRGFGGGEVIPTDGDVPEAQVQPTAPPTVNIVVAARDIPRGRRITLDDLDVMAWPVLEQAPPPLGVLVVNGNGDQGGLEQATERVARMDILAGSPVLETMITAGDAPTDLGDVGSDAALLVPPGQVAIAVPVTRLSSVAYALGEGDHVDVLMSFRFMNVDEEFQSELPNNAVLLQEQTDEDGNTTINILEYPIGREERGVFGNTIVVVPGDGKQAVQQTTQLVIDNAVVMRVGNWPLTDLNQPIVVTAVPTATPLPEGEQPAGDEALQQQGAEGPTPQPSVPTPDIITLSMSRQDALVMKYALEQGAVVDLALRSAADDDIEDIVTDPVTLSYIINARNVTPPEALPIALDPRVDILNGLGEGTAPVQPEPGTE